MNVTKLNVTTYLAAASFALALTATTGASAAPPSGATLTIPAPFGSSPVLAWSWGASNPTSGFGGVGKVSISDLSLTRETDGQSPLFFNTVAKGTHLPTVVLIDGPMTITLTDVQVSSYQVSDSPGAKQATPTDSIAFSFARIAYTVNGVTTCFNLVTNTSC